MLSRLMPRPRLGFTVADAGVHSCRDFLCCLGSAWFNSHCFKISYVFCQAGPVGPLSVPTLLSTDANRSLAPVVPLLLSCCRCPTAPAAPVIMF
jgi:hypothetical protein